MHGKFRLTALLAVFVLSLGIAGCGGSDGDDGAPGPAGPTGDTGPQGEPGEPAVSTPVESCTVCHGETAIADAYATHVVTGIPTVSDVLFTLADPDLVVTFNLKIDGRNASADDGFAINSDYRLFESAPGEYTLEDLSDAGTPAVLSGGDDGNFTITVENGAAYAATNSRYEFRLQKGERPDRVRALVVADYPDVAYVDLVTDQACQNCHSELGAGIHRSYPMGASQCVVCHSSDLGPYEDRFNFPFVGIIHGIHAAHTFPDGKFVYEEGEEFHTTYPSYMNNCSVCHQSDVLIAPDTTQLDAANSMRVEPDNCFSCHGSTETMFEPDHPFAGIHVGVTSGCGTACHVDGGPGSAYQTVTDVHNGATTERNGIIWDGVDTSVTEGALFDVRITGVADDGTDLTVTWEADYNGTGVDPCNDTVGPGAPVFFLPGGSNGGTWSVLRNYAQGEDFILGIDTEAAGQPESENLTAENTTCSGNVATTVVPVEATDATVGRVGLQGKPGVVSVADSTEVMRVRAKSATYDWVIGSDEAATPRRAIVDTTNKCLKCHVGSLYQHGGNRVDNIDLCILCHNSAANEQYVREGMGVDPSEAYDGQAGELFEMKTMLHAVHASGEAQIPFVIYRGRGIYAWAADESLVPNWPTEEDCVYGSNDTPGSTVFGSEDAPEGGERTCQPHNFHSPTYPRQLYDCGACHVDGFDALFPDATKAMASTVEAGEGPDWSVLTDDVLEGASSASCMSCHKQFSSADRAEYNSIGAHAAQNGWEPQDFEEGRKTIIEANQ